MDMNQNGLNTQPVIKTNDLKNPVKVKLTLTKHMVILIDNLRKDLTRANYIMMLVSKDQRPGTTTSGTGVSNNEEPIGHVLKNPEGTNILKVKVQDNSHDIIPISLILEKRTLIAVDTIRGCLGYNQYILNLILRNLRGQRIKPLLREEILTTSRPDLNWSLDPVCIEVRLERRDYDRIDAIKGGLNRNQYITDLINRDLEQSRIHYYE